MNTVFIKPFIEAGIGIINETTNMAVCSGNVHAVVSPYKCGSVAVIIGMTGQVSGSAVLSTNEDSASKICSDMMGGLPVSGSDGMAESAISELCNMILGHASSMLYKKGIGIDITPPTVMTGDNIKLSSKSEVVCIPFVFETGEKLELFISYEDNGMQSAE